VPFNWDASADVTKLRVGYQRAAFEGENRNNDEALRVIRSLGVTLVPFALPDVAIEAIDFIRYAETAAAFDDVARAGVLTEVEQGRAESAPRRDPQRALHPGRGIHQANRLRMRVMEQADEAFGDLDLSIGSNRR
jgi:hypothetical protein